MKELGIYLHIPFCERKCSYCDFVSYANQKERIEEYGKALLKEIEIRARKIEERKVSTVYLGGGTPSLLDSRWIEQILEKVREEFVLENPEITIEVNPGTVTKQKLEEYHKMGINRISIGLQATQKELLQRIGRIHDYEQFVQTYEDARNCGFCNCNVDLMLALPGQTLKMLEESVRKIVLLEPEHISVYSLILEEGTPMAKWIEEGKMKLPKEEIERKMYWKVKELLEKAGYFHYEISNFAKPDYFSKHNWNCWNQGEYLGFGVAAHSYYNSKRFSNTTFLEEYIQKVTQGRVEEIMQIEEIQNKEEVRKEYMLLGLRKIEGVSIGSFKQKFGENPIYHYRKELDKLIKQALVEIEGDNIKLTTKGLDLANLVWEEFV